MKRIKTLTTFTLLVLIVLVRPAEALWGKVDYSSLETGQVTEKIKNLDSHIKEVKLHPFEGQELILMDYKARIRSNTLLTAAIDLKKNRRKSCPVGRERTL